MRLGAAFNRLLSRRKDVAAARVEIVNVVANSF
jgi:hypothetical protein